MEHPVLTAIRRAAFTPLGWFALGPDDRVPEDAKFVILIGNAGPDMFRRFARVLAGDVNRASCPPRRSTR